MSQPARSRNQNGGSAPYLSPLHGPLPAWDPEYDVQQRMWELGKFWGQGVTPALYDALKHVERNLLISTES